MSAKDSSRVPAILDDLRRFGVTARRVVHRGRERFLDPDDDDQVRIAKSVLIDVSSAADRLPECYRDDHPDIDWQGIRGVRNFIAHDYDGTDADVIWRAIAVDLPHVLDALGVELDLGSPADPDLLRRDLDEVMAPFGDDPYER